MQKTINPNQFILPCITGLSISIFIINLLTINIFYHYDTENMSISIGNKNQSRFKNRYGAPVILTYFCD